MKVIASSLRKGNVVDIDGQLYVVLTAQNIHPGKGTPVTQLDMRRISDGVKVSERYRTTEQVERAFVEDREHTFLYQDGEGYHFMNPETYDQVAVPQDIIGDQAAYLQEGMAVMLSTHNGVPIAIELPQRVTLEITETEPVVKGQTASSSYKPAMLSNGVRTLVPPHITAGTRVVIMTAGRLLRGAGEGLRPLRRPCTPSTRSSPSAGAPPIPEAQGWTRAYDGARGPLVDLSQAAPGTPPHPELLRRLAASAGAAEGAKYGPITGDEALRAAYAADVSALYGGRVEPGRRRGDGGLQHGVLRRHDADRPARRRRHPADAVVLQPPDVARDARRRAARAALPGGGRLRARSRRGGGADRRARPGDRARHPEQPDRRRLSRPR